MAYQTISVVVTDKSADAAALSTAAALATREDAHLDVYCIGIDHVRYESLPIGAAAVVLETGVSEAREKADELVKWVKSHLAGSSIKLSVEPVIAPQLGLDTIVERLVRYSDLIVASKPYGTSKSPLQVNILEAELLGTSTPVLVAPEGGWEKPFEHIVVGWNESSESYNAIRAALPLLKLARKVDIVMVDPPTHSPERSDPGGSISLLLARHGVKAEVSILARTLPRISEILNRFATEHECDLLVMGGYGHSRFRESILGGATRDLLEGADVPLLMAH